MYITVTLNNKEPSKISAVKFRKLIFTLYTMNNFGVSIYYYFNTIEFYALI